MGLRRLDVVVSVAIRCVLLAVLFVCLFVCWFVGLFVCLFDLFVLFVCLLYCVFCGVALQFHAKSAQATAVHYSCIIRELQLCPPPSLSRHCTNHALLADRLAAQTPRLRCTNPCTPAHSCVTVQPCPPRSYHRFHCCLRCVPATCLWA